MSSLEASNAPLLPGSILGMMGGGQLGRMWAHAAQRMGYFTAVLDPDGESPAGRISHFHIQTAYTDPAGLAELSRLSEAISTEFENVPAQALAALAQARPVYPEASSVAIAQDRASEKSHFASCGVPCAPYALIETLSHCAGAAVDLFPGILKTSRLGYDGKGQVRVNSQAELESAWRTLGEVPCVLEKMLPLLWECSVVVARALDGTCVNLPVQRNLHRDGILVMTEVYEGNVPEDLAVRAIEAAKAIARNLAYVGVLCVEFFVLDPSSPEGQFLGGLVVNEMAPRPHNSGHYSIDACDVSQFELQVRCMGRLPIVQPRQHSAAIMLNLMGDLWLQGTPPWERILALPGAHLHLYGKTDASKGRKMGHLTITAGNHAEARATATRAANLLGIAAI